MNTRDNGDDNEEDDGAAKQLIETGADVNAKDYKGRTRLHEHDILELVKKYLAEAAPNSRTQPEIHNKLKEEGLPATQSFATRLHDLLARWVSEGILVRVGHGVYKLADN